MSSATLGIDRLQQSAWDRFARARAERGRREWKNGLVGSAIGHAVVLLLLVVGPRPGPSELPPVVSIDLVAAPRAAAAPAPGRPAPAPAPPKAAPPPPEPTVAPAPPPPPKAQTKVLPKEAPQAKAKPAPAPPVRRERPKELGYEDALAALRAEAGEASPSEDAAEEALDAPATATGGPSGPGRVDPELAAWQLAVKRHIQKSWVVPTEFRGSGLRALLRVTVLGDGTVIGAPAVQRSSGDPRYDDNAVRAVGQASPLPPPPSAGDKTIWFSEE